MHHARRYSSQVIVIYGSRCYIDPNDPSISIDKIIEAEMSQVTRINAKNCIDMLASSEERERISNGKKVYWLSPGWLKYWKQIFKDWDAGLANEIFPRNDKAMLQRLEELEQKLNLIQKKGYFFRENISYMLWS